MNKQLYHLARLTRLLLLIGFISGCDSDTETGNDTSSDAGAGMASTGGKSGSTSPAGGKSATGGKSSTPDTTSNAGSSSIGGSSATSGTTATGGNTAIGGTTAAGGNTATGGTPSTVTGTATGGSGGSTTTSTSTSAVTVTLGESTYTFDTPDLSHTFSATVTGNATTTVTWTSSNTYIATVNASGSVTSVSGGTATITATSTADPSKTATATVTVAEPNRTIAPSYIDAKSITSGPINVFMCGDSIMRTYVPSPSDQTGWGQVLNQFFTSNVTVDNSFPNGGRSSRSFYNEAGRWISVKARLAEAKTAGVPTFVLINFGHNDQKKITDTDGALYLTFARTNPNGTVAGTYYDYLERYIVETRELGGIPILITPFVRQYLEGTPATVTATGQHNITTPYAGEASARGNYPDALKAVALKHNVPVVDVTAWSKTMVEARAAAGSLAYLYIAADQTHIRNLGALLLAQEVVRSLNAQGILTNYAKTVAPRLMLDSGTLAFGSTYTGTTVDKNFRITPFGDTSGTIDITAPAGYTVSLDGATFSPSLSIPATNAYVGSVVTVRFSPTDAVSYNANLTVTHSALTPDYGNTVANPTPGVISLTGNGRVALSGAQASVTWPMFSGTTIVMTPNVVGALSATNATLTGLIEKNVANGAARFDTPTSAWPAEGARNAGRYIEYTVPITSGTFTFDGLSLGAGTGGGSNIRWDVVYSLTADFASPTELGKGINGAKDVLVTSSYTGLGVNVTAGQTLFVRVYPYSSAALTSGKSFMIANVAVSGVTN